MAVATKNWLQEISLPIYALVLIFNLASWIDLNALWVEMPLMVNRLPEGWEFPTYIVLIVETSKVGLIVYAVLKKFLKDRIQEWPFVYFIIGPGSACMLALGFVWEKTTVIGGKEVSLAVMVLTASLSLVDSMSSVVFLPYMSRFAPQYLTAFFLGEGLCQLLPSLLSMLQGVEETPHCANVTMVTYNETMNANVTGYVIVAVYPDPRFSVKAFFGFMFCIMFSSGVAFTFLHFHPYCKKHHLATKPVNKVKDFDKGKLKSKVVKTNILLDNDNRDEEPLHVAKDQRNCHEDGVEVPEMTFMSETSGGDVTVKGQRFKPARYGTLGRSEFAYIISLISWSFGLMYGIVPSILAYSCLPYGNRAFNLAIRLGLAMNPIASFLALFISTRSKIINGGMVALGTLCTGYILYLACVSPEPPLKGTALGETLVIMSYVLVIGMFNYSRSCFFYVLQERGQTNDMMWGGMAMHIGATIGAVIMFAITKTLNPFTSEPPCLGM